MSTTIGNNLTSNNGPLCPKPEDYARQTAERACDLSREGKTQEAYDMAKKGLQGEALEAGIRGELAFYAALSLGILLEEEGQAERARWDELLNYAQVVIDTKPEGFDFLPIAYHIRAGIQAHRGDKEGALHSIESGLKLAESDKIKKHLLDLQSGISQ